MATLAEEVKKINDLGIFEDTLIINSDAIFWEGNPSAYIPIDGIPDSDPATILGWIIKKACDKIYDLLSHNDGNGGN